MSGRAGTAGGRVVVECRDLDANLEFFTGPLSFRIERVSPADDPREVDLRGHGLGLRLVRSEHDAGGHLLVPRLPAGVDELLAPNGTRVTALPPAGGLTVPPGHQELVISRLSGAQEFAAGRAGMGYRDLIPGRLGGRFIASHILIADAGPVPDYVHSHEIRFQLIFCYRGWVKVVYEDQGDPFVLEAGDCVLQPPGIRHRVLESSAGLQVIEVGCPAEHDTFADHDIALPTGRVLPERRYGGQRFVRHRSRDAAWGAWTQPGFRSRAAGIGEATGGLAEARVVRPADPGSSPTTSDRFHDGELCFWFVLDGEISASLDDAAEPLDAGDSIVIPAGMRYALTMSADAELLEVTLPATLPLRT